MFDRRYNTVQQAVVSEGQYGLIRLCHRRVAQRETQHLYVAKHLSLCTTHLYSPGKRNGSVGEVAFLKKCRNEHVVELLDFIEDLYFVTLVFPHYEEGDVAQLVNRYVAEHDALMPSCTIVSLSSQLLAALKFVHKQSIVHRDVKCENIFVSGLSWARKEFKFVLGDFGCATSILDGPLTTIIGTEAYFAPEMWMRKPYNELVDMWSTGVTIYTASTCSLPFEPPYKEQILCIRNTRFESDDACWAQLSPNVRHLITWNIAFDATQRPSASAALAFLSGNLAE